jgi:hypothetical protein
MLNASAYTEHFLCKHLHAPYDTLTMPIELLFARLCFKH